MVQRRRLLSRREVALRFEVSPQTVTRWARAGVLPYVKTIGGQRRYPDYEVERILGQLWENSLISERTSSAAQETASGASSQPASSSRRRGSQPRPKEGL